MVRPLPNFLIIGAQKSGTTSLYEYLRWHPDIFMSFPMKEPGLFLGTRGARSLWAHKGIDVPSLRHLLDQHMLHGHRGERLFGEASHHAANPLHPFDLLGETFYSVKSSNDGL